MGFDEQNRQARLSGCGVPCLRLVDMLAFVSQTCLRKAVGMAPGSQTRFIAFGDPHPTITEVARQTSLYAFGKVLARFGLCHPEAQPKDLGTEREVSPVRRPDPSLRSEPALSLPKG